MRAKKGGELLGEKTNGNLITIFIFCFKNKKNIFDFLINFYFKKYNKYKNKHYVFCVYKYYSQMLIKRNQIGLLFDSGNRFFEVSRLKHLFRFSYIRMTIDEPKTYPTKFHFSSSFSPSVIRLLK